MCVCVKLCSFTFFFFFFSVCVVEVMAKASFRPISQWLDRAPIKVYQLQFGLHYFFFFFLFGLQDFVWSNQLDVRLKGAAGAAHWFGWNHREEMREKKKGEDRRKRRGEKSFSQEVRGPIWEKQVWLFSLLSMCTFSAGPCWPRWKCHDISVSSLEYNPKVSCHDITDIFFFILFACV